MAITTTIDVKKNVVHHQIDGILTSDEIVEAIESLFRNPQFNPDMNIIGEVMPGSTSALSSEDIHRIVKITRNLNNRKGPGKTVIVVSSDADYGVFYVLEFLLKEEDRELKVCRALIEAQNWLNT
jgi:hypothetical protein